MLRSGSCSLALLLILLQTHVNAYEGSLDAVRNDVRGTAPAAAPSSSPPASNTSTGTSRRRNDYDKEEYDLMGLGTLWLWVPVAAATVASSPVWAPIGATDDDGMATDGYFQRYPYHVTRGTIVRPGEPVGGHAAYELLAAEFNERESWLSKGLCPPRLRRWSGRFSADYGSEFNDLERTTGRLVFNTASRFGLDTEMNYFNDQLPGNTRDHLWLGDANVVYRFAQSNWSEWRIGLGMNWLDDRQQTDYGFNFTYGVDLYVHRPWITSLDIDWGTLGNTGLFRLRTTTGVVFWGLETYVGYEYLDIGRTQTNSLLGGVRVWF